MTFNLLKQLENDREKQQFMIEFVYGIDDIISEDKELMCENIKKFISWANTLIDRPVIGNDQIARDPTVDAKEAKPYNVKDANDALAKLAKTVAGLLYFMNKNVDGDAKAELVNGVEGDKQTTAYVKDFGVEKASDIVDKVLADMKTKERTYTKGLLAKLDKFYGAPSPQTK